MARALGRHSPHLFIWVNLHLYLPLQVHGPVQFTPYKSISLCMAQVIFLSHDFELFVLMKDEGDCGLILIVVVSSTTIWKV